MLVHGVWDLEVDLKSLVLRPWLVVVVLVYSCVPVSPNGHGTRRRGRQGNIQGEISIVPYSS